MDTVKSKNKKRKSEIRGKINIKKLHRTLCISLDIMEVVCKGKIKIN